MRPDAEPAPCFFPKCPHPGTFPVEWRGKICEYHADYIWHKVEWRDSDKTAETIVGAEFRSYVRVEARAKRESGRRKPAAMGEIYFVQVGELVKVGWTTKLADRIRAYGPEAILLANYPGTRSDEAALHRQLTPARYRGREWYSNTDVVRMFVSEAVEKYGPPRFDRIPWTEPKQVVAGKRAMRYRN